MIDGLLGLPPIYWFETETAAMLSVILMSVWLWTPFVTTTFLAGLQTALMPRDPLAFLPRYPAGLVVGVCARLQGPGGVRMRPVALRCDRGQARRIIGVSRRKHRQYCLSACP